MDQTGALHFSGITRETGLPSSCRGPATGRCGVVAGKRLPPKSRCWKSRRSGRMGFGSQTVSKKALVAAKDGSSSGNGSVLMCKVETLGSTWSSKILPAISLAPAELGTRLLSNQGLPALLDNFPHVGSPKLPSTPRLNPPSVQLQLDCNCFPSPQEATHSWKTCSGTPSARARAPSAPSLPRAESP
jgi:hypothetical protein